MPLVFPTDLLKILSLLQGNIRNENGNDDDDASDRSEFVVNLHKHIHHPEEDDKEEKNEINKVVCSKVAKTLQYTYIQTSASIGAMEV